MADQMSEKAQESYHLSSIEQLKILLKELGWADIKISGFFSGIEGIDDPFKERKITKKELEALAKKLDSLKTKSEQKLVIIQFTLGTLVEEIGKNYSFKNPEELQKAIEEQGAIYPKAYLHQPDSSFLKMFKPKPITKEGFDKLITSLKAITGEGAVENADRGALIRAAFSETTPTVLPAVEQQNKQTTDIPTPYPDKQKAFADALMNATTFPFKVQYTEGGKSYELEVISRGDAIVVGDRSFQLHGFAIPVNHITLNNNKILISDREIEKTAFIGYIGSLFSQTPGTYPVGTGLTSGKIKISGEFKPKEIDTPKQTVNTSMLEKLTGLKTELEKRMKEGLTPIELTEGLKYIYDTLKDEPTKQLAINFFLNKLSESYTLLFEKDGKLNIVPNEAKNTANAASYQLALQSSLDAKHISKSNIQESMTMLTGQRWSDYARTIADPKTANAQGYAKYLADSYDLDIEKKPVSLIQRHKTMSATDKAWLLSYLNGQMNTLDVVRVTTDYKENLKNYETLIDSPFFAVLNKVTGGASLTPEQRAQAAEAAARGSSEGGGDGKSATWALGILAAIVGLGFKKGEGWSLWTSLKRIFMGGLAVGGVMLGCAAGREWKKELGMDVCEEAKKALKDTLKDMRGAPDTPAPAPAAPAGQQQNPAAGPAAIPRTPSQEKGYQEAKKSETLINTAIEGAQKRNPKLIGNFDSYINFIHSKEFQEQKLSSIILTENSQDKSIAMKNSVFTLTDSFSDLKTTIHPDLDNTVLKIVLRAYFGIPQQPSGTPNTPDWGEKERTDFIARAKIDTSWKDKNISELTTHMYTA